MQATTEVVDLSKYFKQGRIPENNQQTTGPKSINLSTI